MSLKCQVLLVADGADKTTYISVRRIRVLDEENWYAFPEELQKITLHKSLAELPSVKSAVTSIRTRGQYRNVNVTLPAEVVKLYRDEDDNFIFNNFFLPETRIVTSSSTESSSEPKSPSKDESLKEILKHFLLEKFSPKNKNPASWCDLFEKECSRFSVSGSKQIEIFKSCLESSMSDWFSINQRKLGITAEWKSWRADLVSTFGDTSWKPIRYAFNFKYLNGSYVDYSVRKEKMLLDLDRNLSDLVILDLIVVGLPNHIQNSLNRNSVTSVKILHSKLKKFESEDKIFDVKPKSSNFSNFLSKSGSDGNISSNSRSRNFNKSSEKMTSGSKTERKLCPNCFKKGFNRFHSESNCWFKDKESSIPKSINNLELESPATSDDDQKN